MQRDDRTLFHRRVKFAAIAVGILGLGLSLVVLWQIRTRRFEPHYRCESYSLGYDPRGCSASDDAAWAALGLKPVQTEPPSEP